MSMAVQLAAEQLDAEHLVALLAGQMAKKLAALVSIFVSRLHFVEGNRKFEDFKSSGDPLK